MSFRSKFLILLPGLLLVTLFFGLAVWIIISTLMDPYSNDWSDWQDILGYTYFLLPTLVLGLMGLSLDFRKNNSVGFIGILLTLAFVITFLIYNYLYPYEDILQYLTLSIGGVGLISSFAAFYVSRDLGIIGSVNKFIALAFTLGLWTLALYFLTHDCSKVGDMCELGAFLVGMPSLFLAIICSIVWIIFWKKHQFLN